MQREYELKRLMVEIGRRIWQRGFVAANDGNISVKLNEREILTTPTGVSKGFMQPEMMVKTDMEGKVVAAHSEYKPSSELQMHLEVYRQRPDVAAVVHAHPPYCTAFAVAGIPLNKCVLPEAIISIGAVPIAAYGLPSTQEIPEKIRPHLKTSDAILLQNHGALTLGSDVMQAYFKMETLEHTAHVLWNAIQLGNVHVLPAQERDRLLELRARFNPAGRIIPCEAAPSQNEPEGAGNGNSQPVSQETILEITKQVIERLRQKPTS